MGEIVNLNRARKAKRRTKSETTAAANRAAHGRSKAEKTAVEAEEDRRDRLLDDAKLEP